MVTQTSLNEEYTLLLKHQLINKKQIKYINKRAVQYAFLTEAEKGKCFSQCHNAYTLLFILVLICKRFDSLNKMSHSKT